MREKIEKVLKERPGLKGKEIAQRIGVDKKEVNSFLAFQPHNFVKDENHCWRIRQDSELVITLDGSTWITGLALDNSIRKVGSPLESDHQSVLFVVPEGCKVLLEAAARLLAMSNQLVFLGKVVTIDFNDCQNTLSYFDRIGFLDHLDSRVVVKPSRSPVSGATIYKGNSAAVYEFGEIDPADLDEGIPQRLKESFVHYAGADYSQPAFTVLSELFGNVRDHSESPIPGYIALQHYKGHGGRNAVPRHIQTIVSDSGKGITGTLLPVLRQLHPATYKKFDFSKPASKPLLVKEVFQKGQISQSTEEGRGLGLKRSGDVAASYNASISVREDTFELRLSYQGEKLISSSYEVGLPKIMGCHICFDFILASG
jgi:hypothetical protein